ncbi:MAG: isochorismatase family protein [Candidatus Nanoarchaeia archaeon]|jgi:nicotinamidase/pyrazinamidase
MKNICFYDVDTQKDFMDKAGALYVPNAEGIKQSLTWLTTYAAANGIQIMGSVDRHFAKDTELKTFPPHCMDKTEGQKKILETSVANSAFIECKAYSAQELKAKMSATAVYFEKQEVSVFSNANANLLTRFDAAVVYGVATEYCVKAAVLGMRQRGIDVLVVEDAIRGINPEGEFYAIEDMKKAGAKFIKTKDVLEGKVEEILKEMWR